MCGWAAFTLVPHIFKRREDRALRQKSARLTPCSRCPREAALAGMPNPGLMLRVRFGAGDLATSWTGPPLAALPEVSRGGRRIHVAGEEGLLLSRRHRCKPSGRRGGRRVGSGGFVAKTTARTTASVCDMAPRHLVRRVSRKTTFVGDILRHVAPIS